MEDTLMMAVAEAKHAAMGGTTTDEILDLAMESMRDYWLSTDDSIRFRGAIGGAMCVLSEKGMTDDLARIKQELKMAHSIAAAMSVSGVALDWSAFDSDFEPIGLMGRWRKVREGS